MGNKSAHILCSRVWISEGQSLISTMLVYRRSTKNIAVTDLVFGPLFAENGLISVTPRKGYP